MSHRYIPLTEKDKQEMLQTIGAKSIGELFGDVPSDILLNRDLNIAEGAISCGCYDFKIRILHSIYAISTGNFSR